VNKPLHPSTNPEILVRIGQLGSELPNLECRPLKKLNNKERKLAKYIALSASLPSGLKIAAECYSPSGREVTCCCPQVKARSSSMQWLEQFELHVPAASTTGSDVILTSSSQIIDVSLRSRDIASRDRVLGSCVGNFGSHHCNNVALRPHYTTATCSRGSSRLCRCRCRCRGMRTL